jgi:hypothetical protein
MSQRTHEGAKAMPAVLSRNDTASFKKNAKSGENFLKGLAFKIPRD